MHFALFHLTLQGAAKGCAHSAFNDDAGARRIPRGTDVGDFFHHFVRCFAQVSQAVRMAGRQRHIMACAPLSIALCAPRGWAPAPRPPGPAGFAQTPPVPPCRPVAAAGGRHKRAHLNLALACAWAARIHSRFCAVGSTRAMLCSPSRRPTSRMTAWRGKAVVHGEIEVVACCLSCVNFRYSIEIRIGNFRNFRISILEYH
jgi:hypothetical protein